MSTQELIQQVNPVVRGWGHHYKRAHVRKLFHRLDGWLVRRICSHRYRKIHVLCCLSQAKRVRCGNLALSQELLINSFLWKTFIHSDYSRALNFKRCGFDAASDLAGDVSAKMAWDDEAFKARVKARCRELGKSVRSVLLEGGLDPAYLQKTSVRGGPSRRSKSSASRCNGVLSRSLASRRFMPRFHPN